MDRLKKLQKLKQTKGNTKVVQVIKGDRGIQGKQGIQGLPGRDGYTPIKGVDYFDGKDGRDGKDGINGKDGAIGPRGPQGLRGLQGEKGVAGEKGINWQGDWTANKEYSVDDVVYYLGSSYICIKKHKSSLSVIPDGSSYWNIVALAGTNGSAGAVAVGSGSSSSGSGDVVGPASSTDKAVALFDGTTGKLLQSQSKVTIDPTTGASTWDFGTDGKILFGSIFGVPVQLFYQDSTDTQYAFAMGGVGVQMGAGGSTAADWTLSRTGANVAAMGSGDKLQQNEAPTTGDDLTNKTYVDSGTKTLTNTRITKRVGTASDATSITPDSDSYDIVKQTNTQSAGTLTINAPTGTPTDGQQLQLRIKTTNQQTFSWNSTFRGSNDLGLPSYLDAGKTSYFGFQYNDTDTKWDLMAINRGF